MLTRPCRQREGPVQKHIRTGRRPALVRPGRSIAQQILLCLLEVRDHGAPVVFPSRSRKWAEMNPVVFDSLHEVDMARRSRRHAAGCTRDRDCSGCSRGRDRPQLRAAIQGYTAVGFDADPFHVTSMMPARSARLLMSCDTTTGLVIELS